jgi:hypothetical protein
VRLERRGAEAELRIEFTAYTTGVIALPPVETPSGFLTDLGVEIASILEPGSTGKVLSGPLPVMAVPGTGALIYGTTGALLLGLLIFLGGTSWWRRHIGNWMERWRKRRLVSGMVSLIRRVQKEIRRGSGGNIGVYGTILNFLSVKFRSFLAGYTGYACEAMTARELSLLPPDVFFEEPAADDAEASDTREAETELSGEFLGKLFRRWDDIRYSGAEIRKDQLLDMLGSLRIFVTALKTAGSGGRGTA